MDRKDFITQTLGVARSFRFRLLTNLANGLLVSPPQTTGNRRRGGGGAGRKAVRKTAMSAAAGALSLTALLSHAGQAQTLPQGGSVVAGNASINQATPNTLNVVQSSNTAIINWQSFNIGAGNTVNFQQPSSSSVTLNRVLGNDPSAIFGTLTANGTVMLINPNGVFFGPGSRVDVGGLVASTANIKDSDFLEGKYVFGTPSANIDARIVNQGDISIKDAGLAALVAPQVQNSGVIRARLGRVALGGAQSFTLDFHGDGLLSFGAGSEVSALPENAAGAALVVNTGQISAEGGVIELSARAVKGVIDNVINTSGVVSAKSVGVQNGKIVLSGGDGGKVQIAGNLDASGTGAGETGGSIIATGEKIEVAAQTRIDASGDQGGGLIAIGSAGTREGAWAGESVSVGQGAALMADAVTAGDGGTVLVLAEKHTTFAGEISAKGGAQGGDGGFAEVSSRDTFNFSGGVDLTAANGKTGTFLLDPATLKIIAAGAGSGTQDSNASDGTVNAGDAGDAKNTITAATLQGLNSTTNIVLEATGLITVDTSVNLATGNGNSFTLRSTGTNGGITFTKATDTITTQGGSIALEAAATGSTLTNIGVLNSNGGNISLISGGNATLAGNIDAGAGTVTVTSNQGSITRSGSALLSGGTVRLSALGGHVGTSAAAINTSAANLGIQTGGNAYVSNAVSLTSLDFQAQHTLAASGNVYNVAATGLTFSVTDASGGHRLSDVSSNATNFKFTSDGTITVDKVNVGSGNATLNALGGNIVADSSSSLITANALSLKANGSTGANGAIGASGQALLTAVGSLSVVSGTGALNVINTGALVLSSVSSATSSATIAATGDVTIGAVTLLNGSTYGSINITSSGGNIVDDGNVATQLMVSGLTLTATTGYVGTSSNAITGAGLGAVQITAGNGGVYLTSNTAGTTTFNSVSATGDITLTNTLGVITATNITSSGNGNIALTSAGNMIYNVINAGTGNVTLNVGGSNLTYTGSSSAAGITASKLTTSTTNSNHTASIRTSVGEIVTATGSDSGSLTISQNGSVTLSDLKAANNIIVTVEGAGAVTTVKSLVASQPSISAISLTTSGAIVGATGNKLSANSVSITAGGAIGSNAQHINTQTAQLSLANTSSYYVDNSSQLLTSLTIDNKHNGSTANDLHLTSPDIAYTVIDDGSKTTLSEVNSTFLTTFSFTSDKTLVLGQLDLENVTTAKLTSTNGSIIDDGNANTRVTAKALEFSAAENIGEGGNAIGINSTQLAAVTGGNLLIENLNHFNELSIVSTHKDAEANYTYQIKARHLDFLMTDSASGYNFTRLIDSGYGADGGLQHFGFSGDRDITLGQVNTGSFSYSYSGPTVDNSLAFTSTKGAILDDGNDSTYVLAPYITLRAAQNVGAATANADVDIVARGVSIVAGTAAGGGGIYVNALRTIGTADQATTLTLGTGGRLGNSTSSSGFGTLLGDVVLKLQLGNIAIGASTLGTSNGSVTLQALAGSLLNPNNNTVIASTKLTLQASEAIGLSTRAFVFNAPEVDATATNGSIYLSHTGSSDTKFNDVTAGGNILLASLRGAVLGKVIANAGAGTLSVTTTGGGIDDDGNDATVIQASEIALTAGGSIGATNQLKVNTAKLNVTNNNSVNITSSQALTDLSITRQMTEASLAITATGQTVALSGTSSSYTLNTLTSASNLNFTLSVLGSGKSLNLGAANVGSGGKFIATTTENIVRTGVGSDKIVAGEVSLTAGDTHSIGASGNAILISSSKLSVNAGRNIFVASDAALSHVHVTSTNSSTDPANKSVFSIAGVGGPTISLEDSGTTQTVDVVGNITDFSLINKKNISISEIVATGAVLLKTEGGGANSNITTVGGGAVTGSSITLFASGTGGGNGSIGSSTRAVKTNTSSLNISSTGNIYLDNSNTALAAVKITSTHSGAQANNANIYSFGNIGSGRSIAMSDSSGSVTVSMSSGSGTMNFDLAVDRAIIAESIDAGTISIGKVTLTSTGTATGVTGGITGNSGAITAGEVILSAKGSTGSGITGITTATQKLSVATNGDMGVTNAGTLTDLALDINFTKSGTATTGTYSHSLSSTGLTFSVEDVIFSNSVSAFKLTSVVQSGLNLNVSSSRSIQVTNVNVGAGTVKLNAGSNSIQATTTSSVLTAGRLEMKSGSVGNTSGGSSTFIGTVGTLKIDATSSINYQNQGNLAVEGITNRSASGADGSNTITLAVNGGSLTQTSGSISTNTLYLKADNGNIGTSGTALQINAETLNLSSGGNVYFNNQADLFKFDWTLKHAGSINQYGITGKNLTVNMPSSLASGSTTVNTFQDTSGLDFNLSVDTSLVVGNIDVQAGRTLALTTTGTTKNITSLGGGTALTAGKITLTSTGSVGTGASVIQTKAQDLYVNTAADVHLNNSTVDLQTLSITSTQVTGGSAPTFGITGENLTLSIVENAGTAAVAVTDTTGLDFTFSTVRPQKLGVINLTNTGSATLISTGTILGSSSDTDRLTAGMVTLKATALGSSADKLHVDSPQMTLTTVGDVYLESGIHLEKLKLTNSSSGSTADRTFDITGRKLDGTAGMSVQAAHTHANGTIFSTITDTSGLDFDFTSDRIIEYGTVNVGKANLLTLYTNGTAIRETDGNSSIHAGYATLSAPSGTVGQTAGTGGGLLDITASQIKIAANNGAYIDLKQKTKIEGFTVAGPSVVNVSDGDLQVGTMSLNGATATITVANGSILGGGSIGGTSTLALTASGAIGAANSMLSISAYNGGTTTLTATASGGGINLYATNALTVSSMTAAGDMVLQVGDMLATKDFTLAGAITATGHKVGITVLGNGSIKSTTSSLIHAADVVLTAKGGSIGASTDATTRIKTNATKLTLNSGANIYAGSDKDLTDLIIDRATQNDNTASSGSLSVVASNLTFSATDNGTTTTLTNITDTTGLNLTFSAKGSIAVGAVNVGSGNVNLNTAAYRITNAGTTITSINGSSNITAGTLSLATNNHSTSGIGTSGQALLTTVDNLTLTTSGAAYVSNGRSLLTGALSAGNALSVKTTSGDLTLNGATNWGSGSALTLDAAGALRSNGISLSAGSNVGSAINLKAGTGIGSEGNAIRVIPYSSGANGSPVSATVTGNGSLYLNVANSLMGGLTTSVNNGATVVNGNSHMVIANMSSATDAIGNDIRVSLSSGNLTLGSTGAAATIGAGMQNGVVVLSTNSGSILQGHADSTINGGGVLLKSGSAIGSNVAALGVNSRRLEAVLTQNAAAMYFKVSSELNAANLTTNNGLISITGGDNVSIDLNSVNSGGGNVTVTGTANSRIGVANVNAGSGTVTLNAGSGAIVDDGNSSTLITAGSLSVMGGAGVGSASAYLNTKVSSIIGGSTSGSVYIADTNAAGVALGTSSNTLLVTNGSLTVTTAGPTSVVNVVQAADGLGKDVKITSSSGDITITKLYAGTATDTGSPSSSLVEVVSPGSILTSGSNTHIIAGKLSLTANGGNIGVVTDTATGAGSPVLVKVGGIDKLSAATASSVVSISNSGTAALTLGSTALTLGSGSSAYVKTAGDMDVSAGLSVSNGNLLLESGGTLTLPSAGSITIAGVLTLKGTTDVVASGGGRTLGINASSLNFTSGSAGGNTTLTTAVSALNASLTGADKSLTVNNTGALTNLTLAANGDITATNSVGFTANSVVASGNNRIVKLTATTGDLTLATVNAGSTGILDMNATAGGILLASGGANMTADQLKLTSASAIGNSSQAFTSSISKISAAVTGTGDIYYAYGSSGGTVGTFSTNDGDINISGTGGTLSVDGSKISAGNSGNLSINTTGSVALTNGYSNSGANTAKAGLSIEGSSISLSGNVITAGAQVYKGNTSVSGNLTAKSISFNNQVNLGPSGAQVFDTSAANGDITLAGALNGNFNALEMKAGTGRVAVQGTSRNIGSLTISGGNIDLGMVTTEGAQSYTGTTTLNGATYDTTGNAFTITGATVLANNVTINTLSGTSGAITFGGSIDSSSQSNLTLSMGAATAAFNGAIGDTGKLGTLTINAGTAGSTQFASAAHTKLAGDLVQTGGATIILPAVLEVDGAITLGTVTNLTDEDPQAITGPGVSAPTGEVRIGAGGNIVMGSLTGTDVRLTINSRDGFIKIGSKDTLTTGPQPDKKIVVSSLSSSQAKSINMYGTVAGRSDKTAAYIVGPLRNPPYFINDMFWGPLPTDNVVVIPPAVVPPILPVPSTPGASSLFTGNVNPAGITPNALAAFTAPQVLTMGAGISPIIVLPSQPGTGITGSGAGVGGGNTSGGGTGVTPIQPTQSSAPLGGQPGQGAGPAQQQGQQQEQQPATSN